MLRFEQMKPVYTGLTVLYCPTRLNLMVVPTVFLFEAVQPEERHTDTERTQISGHTSGENASESDPQNTVMSTKNTLGQGR